MMMTSSPSTFVAILVIFVSAVATLVNSQCHEVHIANFLPAAPRGTVAACTVDSTDLGFATIDANKEYVYKFCGDKTTSFCRLYWGLDKAIVAYVFDDFSGTCRGATCYYALRPDGAYYSDSYPPKALTKKYDWAKV
ncbi:hypothetical protein ABFX02_03G092500 [Erythranthe guttata]